jgi:muramidase (phage lysozyme)
MITISNNLKAFLQMIATGELGQEVLDNSDDGYNVLVGSLPGHIHLFHSYADHPRVLVDLGNGLKSTAAGKFQILARYYDAYKKQLGLPDFSPDSQDKIAIQMIKECGALGSIEEGHINQALMLCASRWASLPSSNAGQHTQSLAFENTAYVKAGGKIAK